MKIRNKILLYFSVVTILLVAIAFSFTYWLFSSYREDAFQDKQNLKIQSTIHLVDRYKKESAEISSILDEQDINDFFDEKLLIFDSDKQLVFSSLDNLKIAKRDQILHELSPSKRWIETTEDYYDLIGVYLDYNGKEYYAISKAYDALGSENLNFLSKVLISIFISLVIILIFISFYIANNLSKPINRLALLLSSYDLNQESQPIENKTSTQELKYLTEKFNELLQNTKEAFAFQKNTTNYISHQLKTPVSVLVSELEKIQHTQNTQQLREEIAIQTKRAKSLGDIISTLLEIANIESCKYVENTIVRIDEILFDILIQLNNVCPKFKFQIIFIPEMFTEKQMEVMGSELLLKQAFHNLLSNAILYSSDNEAFVTIDVSKTDKLKICIENNGKTIAKDEQKYLFLHFFRGSNSHGQTGNGLGLVLSQKIIYLHRGQISYLTKENKRNIFEVLIPKRQIRIK